jgi:hypothetical protein
MLKYLAIIFLAAILFVSTASNLFAASFSLTKIGTLDTQGKQYSQWWYSGNNPTLTGTADPSAQVTVTIDSQSNTATANSSGNWSYTLVSLSSGEHKIQLASGSQSYSFTLTTGGDVPASTSTSSALTQLPVTGSIIGLIFLVIIASIVVIFGFAYNPKKNN